MGSEGSDVTPFAGQRDRVGTGANLGRRVHGGIPRGSRRGVPSPGRHVPRRRPISEARPNDRRWIGFFAPNLTKPEDSFLLPPLTHRMLVQPSGLVKQYPRVRALDQVSLEIKEGEVFGLFGPNGADKTTCLRVLSGLTQPDQGSATVCGIDIRAAPNEVRRELGILIDIPFPYEEVTVRRYLSFFAEMAGVPRPDIPAKVEWTMSLLGVTPHADSRIGKLSMGERQRTELARVMLSTARMLFLDEPFSNVDVSMRIGLRSILREWVSRGGSILFTSHNLLESEAIVDRYAFLHLGRIIALGTARELKSTLLAPAYELEVSNVDRGLAALRAIPHQSLESAGRGVVRIGLVSRDDAPRIARTLIEANVDLLEMKSVGTMEDVYSRLTQPAPPAVQGISR